jgi:hypothetical protein
LAGPDENIKSAVWLTPTVAVGVVVVPGPATLALLVYATGGHWNDRGVREEVSRAFLCIFVFWMVAFCIAATGFLLVHRHRSDVGD